MRPGGIGLQNSYLNKKESENHPPFIANNMTVKETVNPNQPKNSVYDSKVF